LANILILVIIVFLTAAGHLLMKVGMNAVGVVDAARLKDPVRLGLDVISTRPIIFGILVYFFSLLVWLLVLSRVKLGWAYPILALLYVVLPVASWIFLAERMTPLHYAGMFLIVVGVGIVAKAGLA
jgi:multidrug transporter EmrE-like cation transporter